MKKTSTGILSMAALLGGMLLTSCLGDGTNKYTGNGTFTVVKDATGYNLFLDGGGMIRPTNKSVSELTGSEGLLDGDRVYMIYQYTDDHFKEMPGKGQYIDEAELVQGQRIPKQNIMMMAEAESKNLLSNDSIFTTPKISALYAYRGYLTADFSGVFSVVSNKGIYPTLNLVYDPAENERPNTLKLKMLYNRHTSKETQTGTQSFFVTYPLGIMRNFVSGSDSISISIDGLGIDKPYTMKIGREDLVPGDYKYFSATL